MDDFMSGFVTGQNDNNRNGLFGGEGLWFIVILALLMGWGRNGFGGGFGGYGNEGAAANYVLSSDFATLQRMIADGNNIIERKLDSQNAGICDLGYTQAQLINSVQLGQMQQGYETRNAINGIGQQMASCCCDIREGIAGVNYNLSAQHAGLSREVERGFCETNYNTQSQHYATMQAIDKAADRIIGHMTERETQTLRDENQALRLAASQQMQNSYLIHELSPKPPVPAYMVCNPYTPVNYGGGCTCA